jgi:quercetin dioxygenase-like cupin family protein
MNVKLQVGYPLEITPTNDFLKCEDPEAGESAKEAALFNFASTNYEMGARVISIPPNRFFAEHTHPYAHHFIYILQGTGVLIYDGETYVLPAGSSCLVEKGIIHKLGAAESGMLAICVNTPTYLHDDPRHVHYTEEETLKSVLLDHDVDEHAHLEHEHAHVHAHHQ